MIYVILCLNSLSFLEGKVATVEQIREHCDGKGMPYCYANLVLDFLEDEKQVLSDYEYAADDDYGP